MRPTLPWIALAATLAANLAAAPAAWAQAWPGKQPIKLVAKQRFFLRIDSEGIATSLDGKDFSSDGFAKGSVQFGVGATRERGAHASLTLATPAVGGISE